MKHSKRLQRQRARRQAGEKYQPPTPQRPLWVQMLIIAALGFMVIWAIMLNTGMVPNIFGLGKWTKDLMPAGPLYEFGIALDEGRVNVEAAKAIVDDDYRLVGEVVDGLKQPIGVTCQDGVGPNWSDANQFRLIVGNPDILVRNAETDPRQIRIRKYYGEAYNKELVTYEDYPFKDVCRYTGSRLDGLPPVLPDKFGIVPRSDPIETPPVHQDTEQVDNVAQ